MAVGRISGPLLKSNLLRDGIDLAFETSLLYLDVNNKRIGINTSTPSHDLQVNGTTRTTNLIVDTELDIGPITITGNTISTSANTLYFNPLTNHVVYQSTLTVDNIDISTNVIQANTSNTNIEIHTSGTGSLNVYANTLVQGNIHATGNITADGNITIGDQNTDSVTINADVSSSIIPKTTDFYDLGSNTNRWNNVWTNSFHATYVSASNIIVNGINLALRQGNIIYVAANGRDTNSGLHQNDPVATLQHALSIATSGSTVYIYPGTYQEVFPLTIPQGVTVKGASLRDVIIEPATSGTHSDAFLMNGETTVEDITVRGHYFNSGTNTGYAFRFANNILISSRSPYVRNVTVITYGSVTSTSDPRGFNQGDAGKGAYLDGSIANVNSIEVAMLFHSVTFLCPGVDVVTITNGVRVEWLNCFTYWANRGLYAVAGSTGKAGAGKTYLELSGVTGTYNVGETVSLYAADHTTLLASGTIANISNGKITINGKQSGFVEYSSRVGKTITVNGNAQISTTQAKFGGSSLYLDGVNSYIFANSNPDFQFNTGDFTIEAWFYFTGGTSNDTLFDFRTTDVQNAPWIHTTGNAIHYYVNGADRITANNAMPANNTWTHIAVSRVSNSTKMFVNGIKVGATYADTTNYVQSPVTIGGRYDLLASQFVQCYIDDIRITKGLGRYNSTPFTPPSTTYGSDAYTVLLLHFTGTNGSTNILDDSSLVQDVRFSGGATALYINVANYTDFGAEVRSIGSACVYGNYGVYGDGAGVVMYLIGQNLAYIGSGKDFTNDPGLVIQNHEVTQLNGAKIYYTSVDHKGDFRVGSLFYVNQQTGNIQFTNSIINVTGSTGLTFTDGSNTTIIQPSQIQTGNINISGNTISSTINEINVTAANNTINLNNNVNISNNLVVTGNTTINGNTTIGTSLTNTINFVGGINSNMVPSTTATYNLGSNSLLWNNVWAVDAHISDIEINQNYIKTVGTNEDLVIYGNGSGSVFVESVKFLNNTIYTSSGNLQIQPATTLDIYANTNINGDLYVTGNVNIGGNITVGNQTTDQITFVADINSDLIPKFPVTYNLGSYSNRWKTIFADVAEISDIEINTNYIRTTVSNADLELRANGTGGILLEQIKINENVISAASGTNIIVQPAGTGIVDINSNQSLRLPRGTTAQQPGTPLYGMIRYNTDNSNYEGYDGTYWRVLNGLYDVSQTTRLTAELTPGAGDNTFRFYANNSLIADLNSTRLNAIKLTVDNIEINNNTINTINNTDLNLTAQGTGVVKIENFSVKGNTITNTVVNSITHIVQSGTGYFKIDGTTGFVIPVGTGNQRPANPEVGFMRYNSGDSRVETWDGADWISVAGSSSGVTVTDATNISIEYILTLG